MENKVIDLNDFEIVCRICLDKKEKMISMFENSVLPNLIKTYRDMLEECASVQISTNDSLPKNICLECIKYLEISYKFKNQYLSTEILLEQRIANAQTNIKVEHFNDESHDLKNDSFFILNEDNLDEISQKEVIKKEFVTVKEEFIKDTNRELNNYDSKDDNSTVQKYKCEECGTGFKLKVEFYKHLKRVHSKAFKCMFCDKSYKYSYDLMKHSPEVVQCKICKQDYGCKSNLRSHVRVHKEVKKTMCKICGKIFNNKSYKRHEAIHGDKRYLCTFCGKPFADKTNYNIHIRRHTGEKPYQCPQCDWKFCDRTSLQTHLVTHSEERNFECEICKKAFKTKNLLRKHEQTHAQGKIFSCDICNKQFKRQAHIRRHKKIHAGERNYVCTYCNKAFMKSDNLKMHLRTHTGEKPYGCNKCGKSFSQKHALNSHMKIHSELLDNINSRLPN